jgi:hypothetical protein
VFPRDMVCPRNISVNTLHKETSWIIIIIIIIIIICRLSTIGRENREHCISMFNNGKRKIYEGT